VHQLEPVGARVQAWPQTDQIVAIARVAEGRTAAAVFAPAEIESIFDDLGLPAPKISNVLAKLEGQGFVTRGRGRAKWRLTPRGRRRSEELIGAMDLAALAAESRAVLGPHLAQATPSVIPPSFAPPELVQPLRQFLSEYPFDRNVFAMTRFPKPANGAADDPLDHALGVARVACSDHGLTLHLASDRMIVDDLWTNVLAHMWASRYGIAFIEDVEGEGLNYNLTIEVGGMLITGRRTALLKDRGVEKLPTDLVGKIYKSVDLADSATVEAAVHAWLADDLGLGSCSNCPRPSRRAVHVDS
jgi:DNA-binding MarR family transcriptional regulator